MQLRDYDLDNLSVSTTNMRHSKRAPDVSDILPSIRSRGILVPLLVRPNGSPDTAEIVAGRRRYFAAKAVAAERGEAIKVPCAVMDEGDDADALEASLIENIHRQNIDAITEYEAMARLIREGKSLTVVADHFGLADKIVRQRLAIGNLDRKIREAAKRGELDDTTLQNLTLATKAQQKEWLALFENESEDTPFGRDVKDWLLCRDRHKSHYAEHMIMPSRL